VPPDFDDMSLCSIVFEGEEEFQTPKKLFYLFKKKDGSVSTWIYPKLNLGLYYPKIFCQLINDTKYVNATINAKLLSYKDVELGVNANILAYLGSSKKTRSIIEWSIRSLKSGKITGDFYDDELVVYYHLSRAFSRGVDQFEEIKNDIITNIGQVDSRNDLPELLLKFLIFKNFNVKCRLDQLKIRIIEFLSNAPDAYSMNYKYFTSKNRNYYCSSPCLTAAWFLEVTQDW
jgi:hypothetical protein